MRCDLFFDTLLCAIDSRWVFQIAAMIYVGWCGTVAKTYALITLIVYFYSLFQSDSILLPHLPLAY